MSEKRGALKEQSFAFAVRITHLFQYLTETKKEFIISKQVMRSGTSIGAMVREAQNAESSNDFIHKLAIAQKECDETAYWLELLKATDYLNEKEFSDIYNDSVSLLRMLKSAIITTKGNLALIPNNSKL